MMISTTLKTLSAALLLGAALTACSGSGEHETAEAGHAAEAPKSSSAGIPNGRAALGEKLANAKGPNGQSCIECHGKDGGEPIDPTYPVLAGQYADYLAYAMVSYREGRRDHSVMKGQVETYNDQQLADMAAYFASRPSKLTDLSHTK